MSFAPGISKTLRMESTDSPNANSMSLLHDIEQSIITIDPQIKLNPSRYYAIKGFVDWCLAASLLIMFLPVLVFVAAIVLIVDGRPIFYRQQRVGKHNTLFYIWKFRSMCRDAEKGTGPVWSSIGDTRVTRLGKWLRATHLDELPQLFNVIFGHMHMIGPRPERPEFVESLRVEVPGYALRHSVCPGITGLAQIRQGYDASVGDVSKKVSLDLRYIENTSFIEDIKILTLTVPYVFHEVTAAIRRRIQWIVAQTATDTHPDNISPASLALATGSHAGVVRNDALERASTEEQIGETSRTIAASIERLEAEIQEELEEHKIIVKHGVGQNSAIPVPKLHVHRNRLHADASKTVER